MYEVAKARLSTGAGAEPRTTFEKKVSILRGEVYFLDKDLLMGADHGHNSSRKIWPSCCLVELGLL